MFETPHLRTGLASRILAAPRVFALEDQIGDGRANTDTDVEATRRAFGWAGYDTEADLNETIRRFQSDRGLTVDGWMRPGGETARALDESIAPKVLAWRQEHPDETSAPREGVQVAAAGNIIRGLLRLAPIILGPSRQPSSPHAPPETDRRFPGLGEPAPPATGMGTPPLPPEGPDGPEQGTKEEILPVPQEVPIFRGRPLNEVLANDPGVFAAALTSIRKAMDHVLESHRGDETTEEGNHLIHKLCEDEFKKGWGASAELKLTHGAYNIDDDGHKKREKERYLPNAVTKGRKGSSNPDLTFEGRVSPQHEYREAYANSATTLADGKTPTARERAQFDRLTINARGLKAMSFPKLRPHTDRAEWEQDVREKCREFLENAFGKPTKKSDQDPPGPHVP